MDKEAENERILMKYIFKGIHLRCNCYVEINIHTFL